MLIVRAAIMYSNGQVIEGHDYGKIAITANKLSLTGDKIYGFVTSAGDFVLPGEAAMIALNANQLTQVMGILKPEDLWPEWADE